MKGSKGSNKRGGEGKGTEGKRKVRLLYPHGAALFRSNTQNFLNFDSLPYIPKIKRFK